MYIWREILIKNISLYFLKSCIYIVILNCMVFCFKVKSINFFIIFSSIEYLEFLSFLILIAIVCFVLFLVSYFLSPKVIYSEKISSYECGFEPFDDARKTFDIHFYLVAILFLIFDLEVAFLLPWAVVLNEIGLFGFWNMILFIYLLLIGFIYEWLRGALDWSSNMFYYYLFMYKNLNWFKLLNVN